MQKLKNRTGWPCFSICIGGGVTWRNGVCGWSGSVRNDDGESGNWWRSWFSHPGGTATRLQQLSCPAHKALKSELIAVGTEVLVLH